MEEKIVEIGEYTVRMRLEADVLEVVILDALGDEIEGMVISDQEDELEDGENDLDRELDDDDDDCEDSDEGEGDDDNSHYDDDDYD